MAQGWWAQMMHPVPGEVPEHWDPHLFSQQKASHETVVGPVVVTNLATRKRCGGWDSAEERVASA
ncbi:hypothetical protein JHK82_048099 [Glycine max]|nr:hypothetical protein JHK86_047972 [Glycine max]KAG5098245.1 hypothetical protein JHK82_048099 [Glycine max]KAG5103028.1 hypothetical protein JHK84_047997 [Glycine max]